MISAVIALMLLSALLIAFAVLSRSEPTIAGNQTRSLQARAMAESGVEQAIWALGSSTANSSTAPYDGSAYVPVGTLGGFFLTIGNGTAANEKVLDAVGWSPTYASTGVQTAHKHIRLTVTKIKWLDPPAAFSVEGNLATNGSSLTVSAAADRSCGDKNGTYTSGTVSSTAHPTIVGGGSAAPEMAGVPTSIFDQYTFTNADLDMLKALAKANGTYFRGSQTFNSSNPWPTSGIVFVDTPSGNNWNCTPPGPGQTCTNPPSDTFTVSISGSGSMPTLNGWLIVNGSISWSGNAAVNGFVYSQNDINITGHVTVEGAVMSKNIIDTSSSSIDATLGGNVDVAYNCSYAKNGNNTIPSGWFIKPGTYREISD